MLEENTKPDNNIKQNETPSEQSDFLHSMEGNQLMSWTSKVLNQPRREIILGPIIILGLATIICLGITWKMWGQIGKNLDIWFGMCLIVFSMLGGLLLITRQKTIFNYRATTTGIAVEHSLYYPNFAGPLFKGSAVLVIILFIGIAIYTGSLIFLIGPVAMSLGAARYLIGWKNEIKYEKSKPWNEYNFVTIDRPSSVIVIHRTDKTVGFETRFENKKNLEQYLQLLKELLPKTATFTEDTWPY
ncbi:permease [Pseudomonas frederiksbergensis]|uniref:permease n=1 Tax=Pseudomonas frederiksbergensis TaxID=104087 RepID=UPI003D25A3E5